MESYPIYHSMPRAGACGRIWTSPMRRPEPAGAVRVVLANTLNLLPGSLRVSLEGEHLRLNVLDTRHPSWLRCALANGMWRGCWACN